MEEEIGASIVVRYETEGVKLLVLETCVKWPKVGAVSDSGTPSLFYGEEGGPEYWYQLTGYDGWKIWSAVGVRYGVHITLLL